MKATFALLFAALFWAPPGLLEAQAPQLSYTVTYDSKTTHSKRCAKGEEHLVTPMERVGMKTITEENSHQIKVFDTGDVETTITHGPSNQFADWIHPAAKTVVDKTGVKTYDKSGKIISNIPHSAQSLEAYNALKESAKQHELTVHPPLISLNGQDLDDLVKNGGKVKSLGTGKIHIRKDNRELIHDSENKMVEEREFEGKELKHSLRQQFATHSSGRIYVAYKSEINLEKNPQGRRFWNFKDDHFSNYDFKPALKTREKQKTGLIDSTNEVFTVYPNPAISEIWVQIPTKMKDQSATISIKDLLGRTVLTQPVIYIMQSFNIKTLPPGAYIIEITNSAGERQSDRFIKQ